MQLESIDQRSFVDLLDGYTYLPIIPDKCLQPGQKMLSPEFLPLILHEFSHQLAITNVFGAVSACLTTMAIAGQSLANFESGCYMSPLENLRGREYTGNAIQAEAINLFLAHYSQPLKNYYAIAAGSRWLLEGIALFAEHDFRPSKKYEAASQYFEFMLTMLHSQPDREQSLTTEIDDLFLQSYAFQHRSKNKWLLLSNSERRTIPYFSGYIIVRGLQHILSKIDKRLEDPEIFLIFISGYFFNDIRLLDLCSLLSKPAFAEALKLHYTESIKELVHSEADSLRLAIDRIVNYQQYPHSDFHHTDFAALISHRGNGNLSEPMIYEKVGYVINEFLLAQLDEFSDLISENEEEQLAKIVQEILDKSAETYVILRQNGFFFKLKHARSMLLGYNEGTELTTLWTATPSAGFNSAFFIPTEDFQALKKQIAQENLYCSKRIQLETAREQIKYALGRDNTCWLETYDVFDIIGRERFQLLLRNDFQDVRSFYKENIPIRNAAVIKELSSMFSRTGYWDLLQINIPEHFDHNIWVEKTVENLETDILLSVWHMLFDNVKVGDDDLLKFWEKKLYLIAPKSLSELKEIIMGEKQSFGIKDNFDEINKRWEKFVGIPLMNYRQTSVVFNF